MQRKKLYNLDPREYEHPYDKRALDSLHNTKGLDTLVKKFYEYGVEKIFNIQLMGSNLRVTSSSFPKVYALFEEARQVLNLPTFPSLYLHRTDDLQGFTTGVDRPIISISSAAIDVLTEDELLFMIGREIGHIKSQHVLYYEIGTILPFLSDILAGATLGLSSVFSVGLQIALLNWQRMSEYTADRCGLLACQNVTAATTALAKISGLPETHYDDFNIADFVAQARQFEGIDRDNYNRVIKYLSLMFGDQTWSVGRASQLYKWIDAGHYQATLDRKTDRSAPPALQFCASCSYRLLLAVDTCPRCGESTDFV